MSLGLHYDRPSNNETHAKTTTSNHKETITGLYAKHLQCLKGKTYAAVIADFRPGKNPFFIGNRRTFWELKGC